MKFTAADLEAAYREGFHAGMNGIYDFKTSWEGAETYRKLHPVPTEDRSDRFTADGDDPGVSFTEDPSEPVVLCETGIWVWDLTGVWEAGILLDEEVFLIATSLGRESTALEFMMEEVDRFLDS